MGFYIGVQKQFKSAKSTEGETPLKLIVRHT